MNDLVRLASRLQLQPGDLLLWGFGILCLLLILVLVAVWRAGRSRALDAALDDERQRELDDKMAELTRLNAELTGHLRGMTEVVTSRQTDLARLMSERLEAGSRSTSEQLARLGERLAVIDRAQAKLTDLTGEVIGLKDILANKQTRGAFGQGRMEAIVRDALPTGAFDFQVVLSNRTRPDCIIRLPGDERVMVVDAKFPLEAFALLREAQTPEERRAAQARVRGDIGKHVKDIAERYLIPGETQDTALMFVPSESIHADLHEHFEDVVQKAHRARVLIVSPSLLVLAVQVMQSIVRDARMREQAHLIQAEVRHILGDVARLRERAGKLESHLRQAQEDAGALGTSAEKIARRGERIDQMDFEPSPQALVPSARPLPADLFRAAE